MFLIRAGIDTAKLGIRNLAYSVCHAASSALRDAGASVDMIMRKGGWQSMSVFVKHYSLPIKHFNPSKQQPEAADAVTTFLPMSAK